MQSINKFVAGTTVFKKTAWRRSVAIEICQKPFELHFQLSESTFIESTWWNNQQAWDVFSWQVAWQIVWPGK